MTNDDDIPAFPMFGVDSTPEERRRVIAEWDCWQASHGSARSARLVLESIKSALEGGNSLDPAEAAYLANVLEKVLANPKNAEEALGLKRRRGAPSKGKLERRLAGRAVVQLNVERGINVEDGAPNGSWDGIGAISLVAAARGLSEAQVRRGYVDWLKVLKAHAFDNSSN